MNYLIVCKASGIALALVLGSCGQRPWYIHDQARVRPGAVLQVGGGAGGAFSTARVPRGGQGGFPWHDYYLAVSPAQGFTRLQYGLGDRLGVFLEAEGGAPLQAAYGAVVGWEFYDGWRVGIQSGAKLRLGEKGALRVGLGVPKTLSAHYTHDFSDERSASIGLGPGGPEFGLGLCRRLSARTKGFLSANLGYIGSPIPRFNEEDHMTARLMLGLEMGSWLESSGGGD